VKKALLFLFLLFYCNSFTQNIDQLWINFREGSSSTRVKSCEELTAYYKSESIDTLKILGEDLFLYGIDHHYYPAIEQGKLTLSLYFIISGRTSDGITMAKALLANMKERGDDRMLASAYLKISLGYLAQKDEKSAFYWANKAQLLSAKNPDPIVRAEPLIALADAYSLKNQPEKSIETYKKFIAIVKPFNKYRSLSNAYLKLGEIYRVRGESKLSKHYYLYSMDYAKKTKLTTPIANSLNNLAILSFEDGDTMKARDYFEQALELRLKTKNHKSISESYYNLGDYYFYTSNNEKAIVWYKRSLDIARANNLKNEYGDALDALSRVAKSTGDFKGSLLYLEELIELNKEIAIRNSADDEEIAALQQTMIRLENENEEKEKNGELNQSKFWDQFRWEWIVIASLIALIIFSLYRKRSASTKSS